MEVSSNGVQNNQAGKPSFQNQALLLRMQFSEKNSKKHFCPHAFNTPALHLHYARHAQLGAHHSSRVAEGPVLHCKAQALEKLMQYLQTQETT